MFVLAVIALVLLMVNTVVILGSSLTLFQSSRYSSQELQAVNLAEAGIDKAVASLNATGGNYNGETEVFLGTGSFSVSITSKNASTKIIEATGYIPNKANPELKRTVKVEVSKGAGASFNYGVQVGEGGLVMDSNSQVIGSVYSNGSISMKNNSRVSSDAYVAGGVSPLPDQESDCTLPNCLDFLFGRSIDGDARVDVAQSFKPSDNLVISKVALKLKKFGSPSNLTVKITADDNGKPDKNGVLASGILPANLITTSYNFIEAAFTSTPQLLVDTTYWIVLDVNKEDNANYWSWSQDLSQGYTRGAAFWFSDWSKQSVQGGAAAGDFGFKTLMGGIPTSIAGAEGVIIGGSAHANTLRDLSVGSGAYYQAQSNVTAGSFYPNSPDPVAQIMPISEANINEWKDQAERAGVFVGDITSCPAFLPAGKYTGSITLPGSCTVEVSSPIWVTGNLTLAGQDTVRLASAAGASSGVLMVDNIISLANNNQLAGSGTAGSFLIAVSNFNSRDDPLKQSAIKINNNGNSGVFYSNLGTIEVANNNIITEITGWKLALGENVTVAYDQGLAATFFSSGPSGSFAVINGTYQAK